MLNKGVLFLVGVVIFLPSWLYAGGSWEEIFRAIIKSKFGDPTIVNNQLYEGSVYSGNFRFIIQDGDGNTNNFNDQDHLDFALQGTDLQFSGNKTEFTQWVEENGADIYKVIFPSDIAAALYGSSDPQFNQEVTFPNLILRHMRTENTNNFIAKMEYTFAEVGPDDTDVFSFVGIPSYSINFGEKYQNSVGLMVPLRYSKEDDFAETEMFSVTAVPYLKWNFWTKTSFIQEEDRFSLDAGIAPFFHATFASSVFFPAGAGYLRYGGSIFFAAEWELKDTLIVRPGISYQISETYFPDGIVEGEMEWMVDILNDLPLSHEVTVGINFTVPLAPTLKLSLDYFRTMSVGREVNKGDSAVSAVAFLVDYLVLDFLHLNVGCKTKFEIQEYTEFTFLLGGIARF